MYISEPARWPRLNWLMSSRMPTTSHDGLAAVDAPADRRTVEEPAPRERARDEGLAASGLAVAEGTAFDDAESQRMQSFAG